LNHFFFVPFARANLVVAIEAKFILEIFIADKEVVRKLVVYLIVEERAFLFGKILLQQLDEPLFVCLFFLLPHLNWRLVNVCKVAILRCVL
jgi:hypothetical protein